MSADKLKRARQLLAMTATDNVEEARSFAFQACKMIRECGFELVDKGAKAEPPVVPMPKPQPVTYPNPGVNHQRPAANNSYRSTEQDLMDAFAQEFARTRGRGW